MFIETALVLAGASSAFGGQKFFRLFKKADGNTSTLKLGSSDIDKPSIVLAEMVIADLLKLEATHTVTPYAEYSNVRFRADRYCFSGKLRGGISFQSGELTIGDMPFDHDTAEFKLVGEAVRTKLMPLYKEKERILAEQKRQNAALDVLGSWFSTPESVTENDTVKSDTIRQKLIERFGKDEKPKAPTPLSASAF